MPRSRRSLPVKAMISTAVAGSLVLTLGPGARAAATDTPPSRSAAATAQAVTELSSVLGGLDAQPTLDTRLPGTGQAVTDVVSLAQLFNASLTRASTAFTTGGIDDYVAALDKADVPGLGIRATSTSTAAGTRIVLTLGGSAKAGKLYALYADDHLVLDGTSAANGAVPVTGGVSGTLALNVSAGDAPVVTLDPTSTLSVAMSGSSSALSVPARYGFTDVSAKGSGAYSVGVDFTLRDPDLTGGITQQEWRQARPEDLALSSVRKGSSAVLDLGLDSNLVAGTGDGSLRSSLDTAGLTPTSLGDGTAAFADPTLTVGTNLGDFAKVSGDDAIVAVGQVASAYSAAQSRIDVPLPLVGSNLSDLAAPSKPLTGFVEAQARPP